ncbi:MAG: (2Fe-2S)-binding protein [Proteobacteria bacterium]|nr:(2Fe-2S)-binding protein [Pseudomonadota bacterium]MCH8101317.1 (2Fe-2S)-binding protein [Pseudomonadota bacterium]MCH8278203.1 (2Fe-2S)-binding protein [Pseudomonadota bacterium]
MNYKRSSPVAETNIQLTVNGESEQLVVGNDQTLLYVLRDNLGLTGSKDGCSSGDCGACVIMLDGMPVNSCMVLGPQADGSTVVTIEGLAQDGELHPVQRTFGETWAFQCGFCTPGMLISCYALLEANNDPSREEILTAIAGNFCRCTGYQGVVKAVQQAATEMRETEGGAENA